MTDQHSADMQFLMEQPAFRRLLIRSIQTAGILTDTGVGTHGSDGRDLAFAEGRRSLGFFLIREAEVGLPVPLQHPDNVMTLLSVLNEEAKTIGTEKKRGGRNDRYDDGSGNGDGSVD